jgi:hypothetical protein
MRTIARAANSFRNGKIKKMDPKGLTLRPIKKIQRCAYSATVHNPEHCRNVDRNSEGKRCKIISNQDEDYQALEEGRGGLTLSYRAILNPDTPSASKNKARERSPKRIESKQASV